MSLPAWARVGAKVVCINDTPLPGTVWLDSDAPAVGAVYTITGFGSDGERETVYLAEIRRGPRHMARFGKDYGYWIARFRPVHTLEADISTHFQALLDVRAPQLEDAT